MAQHPSPLPGGSARTDTLTFIPTFEEKKPEKKSKKEKDEESSGSRKPSWVLAWTFYNLPWKQPLPEAEKVYYWIVIVLRTNCKMRGKKESSRKSGGENKKEKDGLFSSFFGGGKKKSDRDSGGKKGSSQRALSPDPPHRELKPDIDYNWARFSILEERAIYRMAHIKLANPRRALYSQVLLSNFMYSYLAKVQQMHPQLQIPQSALQKKQEAERRQKEQEQQQQQQEGEEQYRYDYHQGIAQYAEPAQSTPSEGVDYVDDSQIYDYDHHEDESNRPQSRASQHNSENGYGEQGHNRQGKEYYPYGHSEPQSHGDEDEDEMW
ncbi:hypothetical protein G7Y89_g7969 [Cudoniella acicularis]|uniref:Protein Zds1 C-terminal domain-containing protein n=1 Tax=Cudoniella acicularis TaxID=354080 RepID=A0A8H4RL23_9HELO|nr:hypothetical protein G7Y89_g7969 [Cudoniella acicularis]